MAQWSYANSISMLAGADLSAVASRYKVVAVSADNTVILAAAGTDQNLGILERGAASGAHVNVQTGGSAKGRAGASFAVGVNLMANGSGKLVLATATNKVVGIALEAAGADEDIVSIQLQVSQILLV